MQGLHIETVTIRNPWTRSQQLEFSDLQTILLNLFPGLDVIDILHIRSDLRPCETHYLFARLKHLMSMK